VTSETKDVEEDNAAAEPLKEDPIEPPKEDPIEPPKEDPIEPPTRGAFRKGALLATLLIIPGLSVLIHSLASEPLALAMAFDEVFATVAVFAGLPALLVFGGIGKNISRQRKKNRQAMSGRGAVLGAIAGISLDLLAAIPTATFPASVWGSVTVMCFAGAIGAATGGLLGLWIHHAHKRAGAVSEA